MGRLSICGSAWVSEAAANTVRRDCSARPGLTLGTRAATSKATDRTAIRTEPDANSGLVRDTTITCAAPRHRSPARNRVTPTGDIEAIPLRGAWTGNRGILHSGREIVRFHAS